MSLDRPRKPKVPRYLDSLWNKKLRSLDKKYLSVSTAQTDEVNQRYAGKPYILRDLEYIYLQNEIRKRENDSFIKKEYISRVQESRLKLHLHSIEEKELDSHSKNIEIFKIHKKLYPLPDIKHRTLFINEFISFLKFLQKTDFKNINSLKFIDKVTDVAFYKVESIEINIDFSKETTEYFNFHKEKNVYLRKILTRKDVRKIIKALLEDINLNQVVKVTTRPKALFSVNPSSLRLTVPRDGKISRERLYKIIMHEVFGHILRGLNGRRSTNSNGQKLYLLRKGKWRDLYAEEGLASYLEQNTFFKSSKYDLLSLFEFYLRLIGVHLGLHFSRSVVRSKLTELTKIYALLNDMDSRFAQKELNILMYRLYKGYSPPYTKGCINPKISHYLYGNRKIWEYIESGGNINDLFIGKINIDQIKDIKKLGFRTEYSPPDFSFTPSSELYQAHPSFSFLKK